MHNHKDGVCDCGDDLVRLLGSALTNKLLTDTTRAADDTYDDLTRQVIAALSTRSNLLSDELSHLGNKEKEEALSSLNMHHTNHLLCGLLKLTVTIGLAAGETAATYIGHAAAHFEGELLRRAMGPIMAEQAQRIKDDAKARTGSNN